MEFNCKFNFILDQAHYAELIHERSQIICLQQVFKFA